MYVNTPPMGWNSWNTFGSDINETVIRETADALVETGLKDCGYDYLVIDDCWSRMQRDENGRLVADSEKFPSGMKALSDYVHSKGLKFGMYSCAGMITCAGFPGSFDHEFVDAQTFAEWGVDFLKYDYCFKPGSINGDVLYRRMGAALRSCGRDILFSACSSGRDQTLDWVRTTGANMWRSTEDIYDSWNSIKGLIRLVDKSIPYSTKNCFADMDMLVVGMYGNGNVGLTGCTDTEYRTHFAMWALLGSPLMIGCDIRNMNNATKSLLMNRDVIAINQDESYNMPYNICANHISSYDEEYDPHPIYVRLLDNGDFAIGIFNLSDERASMWQSNLRLDILGLNEQSGKTLLMKDLFSSEEIKVANGVYVCELEPHDCRLFRARIVDI